MRDAHALVGLGEYDVSRRLDAAPAWVHERRDRSWTARKAVGEPVTPLQNDRDVLRVCAMYELRLVSEPPFAPWLGVPGTDDLRQQARTLTMVLDG
jgi:hypothetical protein